LKIMSQYIQTRGPGAARRGFRFALALLAAVALVAAVPALAQGGPGHHGGDAGHHGMGHYGLGHHGLGHHGMGAAEAGFAHAMPGRHLGRLMRALDLTEDQKESAKAIFEATRAEAEPIREAQRERHEALRTLLDGDSPDAAEVGALVIAMHEGRAAMKALHDAAFAEFKDLLTVDQLDKLESLEERRGEGHRGHRGGHRGHGGGGHGAS